MYALNTCEILRGKVTLHESEEGNNGKSDEQRSKSCNHERCSYRPFYLPSAMSSHRVASSLRDGGTTKYTHRGRRTTTRTRSRGAHFDDGDHQPAEYCLCKVRALTSYDTRADHFSLDRENNLRVYVKVLLHLILSECAENRFSCGQNKL